MDKYMVYVKLRRQKRAQRSGCATDDFERAKKQADREKSSWWGQNGVYDWVKVRNIKTGKYVYIA